jgi:hypothetical protein
MANFKTVYNDGDLAFHLDTAALLAYDEQTVTVRKSKDDSLYSTLTRRVDGSRKEFLATFPVGSINSAEALGIEDVPVHYTNQWSMLELKKVVEFTAQWQEN